MITMYEFEIKNQKIDVISYKTIEAKTLEEAESILERDVSFDQEHSIYELYDVFTQEMLQSRIKRAAEFQKKLVQMQQENNEHLLSSMIEIMQEGFAVQITPKEIQVFPTLDVTFERKEK